jgi:hypothetical protein
MIALRTAEKMSMFRGIGDLFSAAKLTTSFRGRSLVVFVLSLLCSASAVAGSSQGITYTGRILRADGTPANSGSITFTLKVMDASNNCRLWSETQTVNMTDTMGTFALVVGAGTRTDGGSQTLKQVFTNAGTLAGLTCTTGTTYSPASTDDRNLAVSFDDAGTVVTLSTAAIKSVPFALQADQVSGYGIMNLAKISGAGTANSMTGTQFDFLTNLAAPASASATPCSANDILKYVGGVWTCAAASSGSSSTSGLTAATGINAIDNTNYAQTWNWSTATTENPMTIAANSITTGSLMNLTTSSAAVNSTNGLLNVANTSATSTGVLARFQSNSTAGSGLTVLANGNVGIGTATPSSQLNVFSSTNHTTLDVSSSWGNAILNLGTATSYWRMENASGTLRFLTSGTATYPLQIENSAPTNSVYIKNTGNVGIGTATPGGAKVAIVLSETSNALLQATGMSSTTTYSPTGANSAIMYGMNSLATFNPTGTANSNGAAIGGDFKGRDTAGNSSNLWGIFGSTSQATKQPNGFVSYLIGAQNTASSTTASGTVTEAYGTKSAAVATAATITSAFGMYGQVSTSASASSAIFEARAADFSVSQGAGSTILNGVGVYIGNVQATTKYSLYASDSLAPSYFAGNVGIGTTTPAAKLQVNGGAIVSTAQSISGQCVDFSTGNIQVSSYVATNAVKLGGLVDGGSYTLVLTGYTAGQTITFTGFTDAACTVAVATGVDFGGSTGAVTPTLTAVGNTQLVSFIYSSSRGVVYASAGTNFYH